MGHAGVKWSIREQWDHIKKCLHGNYCTHTWGDLSNLVLGQCSKVEKKFCQIQTRRYLVIQEDFINFLKFVFGKKNQNMILAICIYLDSFYTLPASFTANTPMVIFIYEYVVKWSVQASII